jgi:hypothetical protein
VIPSRSGIIRSRRRMMKRSMAEPHAASDAAGLEAIPAVSGS